MAELATAYLWDDDLRESANAHGENYWFAYVQDLFERIGAPARPLAPQDLLKAEALSLVSTLALPDLADDYLDAEQKAALEAWVNAGGLLIGFATEGLDELFGVEAEGVIEQPGDPWEVAATLRFTDERLARPLHHPERPDPELVAVSDVRLLRATEARELAALGDLEGHALGRPAITLREVGGGYAALFAFDLAHTIWALQQGRPIDADYNGDGYYRMSDAMIIGQREREVPYADLLTFLLRNLVALTGQPLIYQLPALDGGVPDALFFWGGDDEGAAGTQVKASNFMAERGLPYHINIMPREGKFHLSPEEFDQLRANGTEPSLHFNFIDEYEHPLRFTEEDMRGQVRMYREAFGETPVCSVFHWTLWHGWTEPAEWMCAEGIEADNSRINCGSPPLNPTDTLGYAFGTSFPFFFRRDWRAGNERLDFISEPITAYEVGYVRGERTDFPPLHRTLSNAAYWHLTTDMFYHPICVFSYPECREAIDEALRFIEEQGIRAVHMGNDEVNRWWRARTAATLKQGATDEGGITCTAECAWEDGYVVVLPVGEGEATAEVDGAAVAPEVREEFGRRWACIPLESGRHEVRLST